MSPERNADPLQRTIARSPTGAPARLDDQPHLLRRHFPRLVHGQSLVGQSALRPPGVRECKRIILIGQVEGRSFNYVPLD
jgi:hypothetical protein